MTHIPFHPETQSSLVRLHLHIRVVSGKEPLKLETLLTHTRLWTANSFKLSIIIMAAFSTLPRACNGVAHPNSDQANEGR